MLLLNICVLVGAVLTPPSLRWLYSTHIIMLCLYQIHRKDWWGLIFVAISIVSLMSSNPWKDWGVEVHEPSFYWNVTEKCLWVAPPASRRYSVYVKSRVNGVYADTCTNFEVAESYLPVTAHFSKLFGTYAEHTAYIKGVDLMVYVEADVLSSAAPLALDQFSSWRFAYSIVRGDRSGWDERDRWLVNYLGLTHLFVVSGLHVGFVSLFAVWLSRLLWRWLRGLRRYLKKRSYLECVVVVPLCVLYVQWSGAGEPAVRASVMAALFFVLRAGTQKVSVINVLSVAAWGMLLIWPGRALDPSFWLSFAFVLVITMAITRLQQKGRLLSLQTVLSAFSVLLTLGWQQSISGLIVVANLIMVPFVAFLWFPVALLSFALCKGFSWVWPYAQFDQLLLWLFHLLEPYIYSNLYLLPRLDVSLWVKLTLIAAAFFSVVWLPLLRGSVALVAVSCAALSFSYAPQWTYLLEKSPYGVVQYYRPSEGDVTYFDQTLIHLDQKSIAINMPDGNIAHQALKDDWELAIVEPNQVSASVLQKMQVKTLVMEEGERIQFFLMDGEWQVKSSTCYHLLNLLKTDACEHADLLESMLNYSQFSRGDAGVRAF